MLVCIIDLINQQVVCCFLQLIQNTIRPSQTGLKNIKSAENILRGANFVYAYPEVTLNKDITSKGEVIASENIFLSDTEPETIRKKIKLLKSTSQLKWVTVLSM